jgi:hypothetical protein
MKKGKIKSENVSRGSKEEAISGELITRRNAWDIQFDEQKKETMKAAALDAVLSYLNLELWQVPTASLGGIIHYRGRVIRVIPVSMLDKNSDHFYLPVGTPYDYDFAVFVAVNPRTMETRILGAATPEQIMRTPIKDTRFG